MLCQFDFLSSGSQKIATICAMNLHLLDVNPVNAPRCASSQSPSKPGAKCRVSNPSRGRTLRQSKPNPLETASTARPVHVLSLSLSVAGIEWDWIGQAALLRSACIELVGEKSRVLINSHHSRGF